MGFISAQQMVIQPLGKLSITRIILLELSS